MRRQCRHGNGNRLRLGFHAAERACVEMDGPSSLEARGRGQRCFIARALSKGPPGQIRGVALLPDFGVDQEAEPEGLQDPKDQALGPVKNSKTEEVAIHEQSEGSDKEWHSIVLLPEES